MFDVPGKKHRAHGRDPSDQNQGQADAVDREMIFHPEHRHPRDAHDRCEVRKIDIVAKNAATLIANPAIVVTSAIQRASTRGMKRSRTAPANVR